MVLISFLTVLKGTCCYFCVNVAEFTATEPNTMRVTDEESHPTSCFIRWPLLLHYVNIILWPPRTYINRFDVGFIHSARYVWGYKKIYWIAVYLRIYGPVSLHLTKFVVRICAYCVVYIWIILRPNIRMYRRSLKGEANIIGSVTKRKE